MNTFPTIIIDQQVCLTVPQREVVRSIIQEFATASAKHPPLNSAHEGYAIIFEELDELWDEVKKKPSKRRCSKMRTEAIQVGAMAMRFLLDLNLMNDE